MVQMIGWGTFEVVTIATALGQVVPLVPQAAWVVLCGLLTTALAVHPLGSVRLGASVLRFDVEGRLITIFPDGRAIIRGTDDPAVARSLYARYVGS